MDQRAVKRPQSDSKLPPKKKSKKSKTSNKSSKHASDKDNSPAANSLELTATAEGITMTQVMSTFNRTESSRFEAFRRSTFPSNVISTFVAHCLVTRAQRAHVQHYKNRLYLGGTPDPRFRHCPYVKSDAGSNDSTTATATATTTKTGTATGTNQLSLSDLVATGQADEITVVVSTLAKAYAQRLVTAARRVAVAQAAAAGADENDVLFQPLTCEQVLEAHKSRVQAGLDPGFFLQRAKATTSTAATVNGVVPTIQDRLAAAALGVIDSFALQRKAALAAQEDYDKYKEDNEEDKATLDKDTTSGDVAEGTATKSNDQDEEMKDDDVKENDDETENSVVGR